MKVPCCKQSEREREKQSCFSNIFDVFSLFVCLRFLCCNWLRFFCTGTIDTHPPDTYFGIEVEPSAPDQFRMGNQVRCFPSVHSDVGTSTSGFAAPNG